MINVLLVGLGGSIGAMLRYLSTLGATRLLGAGFPYGTMFVNVVGSFLMGLFIAWLVRRTGGASNELRLFVATGLLGGFTTFSAFSLDAITLYERGEFSSAAIYVLCSVVISILALAIGLWAARSFA